MLYNEEERAVMANAIQPNMRAGRILPKPFLNILDDYFKDASFAGLSVLDIGPGQSDFLDLVKLRGAKTFGCDFDPAVAELGRMRGHEMKLVNLHHGWPYPETKFDFLFCRGSINCFWFSKRELLSKFLESLIASLADGGLMWIAPWNKAAEGREGYTATVREVVDEWAEKHPVRIEYPPAETQTRYAIKYAIPTVEIWVRC